MEKEWVVVYPPLESKRQDNTEQKMEAQKYVHAKKRIHGACQLLVIERKSVDSEKFNSSDLIQVVKKLMI